MKLIELLARELKEWPSDCSAGYCVQSNDDGEVFFGGPAKSVWLSTSANDSKTAKVTREEWEAARLTTPTLETMLTEWRDLEARAQAAQAEADALFEHAGQCHGEVVVRLAELGWGAPRGPMVPGEPVVTLDEPECRPPLAYNWHTHVEVGDMLTYRKGDGKCHMAEEWTDGQSYRVHSVDRSLNTNMPWQLYCDDGETYYWGTLDYFTPSTQP
jgi:hypothetical protein